MKRNKVGRIRKKPGRKSVSQKPILMENIYLTEVNNNLTQARFVEIVEVNNSNNMEPDYDKALLRSQD